MSEKKVMEQIEDAIIKFETYNSGVKPYAIIMGVDDYLRLINETPFPRPLTASETCYGLVIKRVPLSSGILVVAEGSL